MYGHFAEIFTVKSAGGCTAKRKQQTSTTPES
jgi:hypothetical protein